MNTVRVWNAFAANNSTAYRLVADFSTGREAAAAAEDLRSLFKDTEAGDSWWPEGYPDGPPEVLVCERRLILYSDYCLGFPGELKEWLTSNGAALATNATPLGVSMAFPRPAGWDPRELEAPLAALRAELSRPWAEQEPRPLPWTEERFRRGGCGFFFDGTTVLVHFPSSGEALELARAWLGERGVPSPRVTLCEDADAERFNRMHAARCPSCASPGVLRYVAAERHGVDREQLACTACGAMYDLEALLAKAPAPP